MAWIFKFQCLKAIQDKNVQSNSYTIIAVIMLVTG